MSKEVGGMVGSRREKGVVSARPDSAPTARRLTRLACGGYSGLFPGPG